MQGMYGDASEENAGGDAFAYIFDGRSQLEQLMNEPSRLSRDRAVARLEGWAVGRDQETTCLVGAFTHAGWSARHRIVVEIETAAEKIGIAKEDLRLGGPALDSVTIDRISGTWLVPLGGVSVIVGLGLSIVCLRKIHYLVATFAFATLSWLATVSLLPIFGTKLDSVLIAMPALIYVLAMSSAVHLSGYLEQAQRHLSKRAAIRKAVEMGWAPCSVAALTTAIGLASLIPSGMIPVRNFGIYSSLGVILTWGMLFVFWPAIIDLLWRQPLDSSGAKALPAKAREWWLPLFQIATQRNRLVVLGCVFLGPLLVFGVAQTRTSVRLSDMFASSTKIHRDYEWIERELSGLVPIETIVRFDALPDASPSELVERLQLVESIRSYIGDRPQVSAAVAASNFLPEFSNQSGMRGVIQRRVMGAKLSARRHELVEQQWLYDQPATEGQAAEELWRITGRVPALGDLPYAEFLEQFETDVSNYIQQLSGSRAANARVTVCGGVFQVARAQQQLLRDMGFSVGLAFVLIAFTMIVLTKSLRIGLLAMIPNMFPALVVFGAMGWMEIAVDIGAMMTATVALGIAVDDTSHFLWWFFKARESGGDVESSIRTAFEHCATAMVQTSLICGLGLGAFAFSPFLPIGRFGTLMAALLFAALVGDLLILPAILRTAFVPRNRQTSV